MDGNGRWATRRRAPRFAGHSAGVNAVRDVVGLCVEKGIDVLTLFAFSSENWQRPAEEVGLLMNLFLSALSQEMKKLHENNIRLEVIGDRTAFGAELQALIAEAEALMSNNTGLRLVIAANYGGRWDITQAVRKIADKVTKGELTVEGVDAQTVAEHICAGHLPEPDLFIRTGGKAHQQLYALAPCLHGTVLYRRSVARLRPPSVRGCLGLLRQAPAPLWAHRGTDRCR